MQTLNVFIELLAIQRANAAALPPGQLEFMVSEMKLYIDDVRPCPAGWALARNAVEAIHFIRNCNIDEISFDHDLGSGMTGYDVACEIERIAVGGGFVSFPRWSIHSSNPVGRANIERAMRKAESLSR